MSYICLSLGLQFTLSLHALGQLLFSWISHGNSEQQKVLHLPKKIDKKNDTQLMLFSLITIQGE